MIDHFLIKKSADAKTTFIAHCFKMRYQNIQQELHKIISLVVKDILRHTQMFYYSNKHKIKFLDHH